MGKSDVETLVEMGFPRNRVEKAIRRTGGKGLQPAMDWLLAHSEDPDIDDPEPSSSQPQMLQSAAASGDAMDTDGPGSSSADRSAKPADGSEPEAKSFKCSECGKILRDSAAVQLHAVRTGHEDFEESEQEIAPLTEEQKKEQLARLKEKLAQKRQQRQEEERQAELQREIERRKLGKVSNEVQQKYMEAQQAKKLEEERRKRQEEKEYRDKLRKQLEQDKLERQARRKAELAGTGAGAAAAAAASPTSPAAAAAPAPPAAAAPAKEYTECRLQVRLTNNAALTSTFKADDPFQLALDYVRTNRTDGAGPFQLVSNFPRRVFTDADGAKTFRELA